MTHLLMPGRQIITTKFQEEYLKQLCRMPVNQFDVSGEFSGDTEAQIDNVVFAITSANQANSRYNPLPLTERAIGVDRFMQPFNEFLDVSYDIAEIPHYQPTNRFAHHVIEHCNFQLPDTFTPQNTIIFSSTPSVVEMFRELGYCVATGEYDPDTEEYTNKTPRHTLDDFMEGGMDWFRSEGGKYLSSSHAKFWEDTPRVPEKILRIANEPLLTEEGSLTETRSYSSYSYGMAHSDLLDIKYGDVKDAIRPGRIVDEGCADGALLERISDDFPDSDLIGIEITSEFTARFKERVRSGAFGGTFIHFYQRNLLDPVFEDNSIDTVLCNSTTHEFWSYGDREDSLMHYLDLKYDQLKPGGHLVIRDVIGPKHKDQTVAMWLNSNDGDENDPSMTFSDDEREAYAEYLDGLSTRARFERFVAGYLPQYDEEIIYETVMQEGKEYIVIRLKDAVEFMTKKDYTDNWRSELHEEFAFWDIDDWCQAVNSTGFSVVEDTHNTPGTRVYQNDWIVENRWQNAVEIYQWDEDGGVGERLEYPPTNIVLVAQKPTV